MTYWSKNYVLYEMEEYFEIVDGITGEVVMEVYKWY